MEIKRCIAPILAKGSMTIATLIFSFTTLADPIVHTHGDRSHGHNLPANGLSHKHGSLPPANEGKNVVAPVANNSSFSVISNKSNCNNAESCWNSALLEKKSNNHNGAASNFIKSCDYGKAKACVMAGKLYFEKKQFKKARSLFEKACYGNTDKVATVAGCSRLADLHNEIAYALRSGSDYGTLPSALQLYKRGCNAGAPAPFGDEVCRKYNYYTTSIVSNSGSSSSSSSSNSYSAPQKETCSRTVYRTEYAPGNPGRTVQIPSYETYSC